MGELTLMMSFGSTDTSQPKNKCCLQNITEVTSRFNTHLATGVMAISFTGLVLGE